MHTNDTHPTLELDQIADLARWSAPARRDFHFADRRTWLADAKISYTAGDPIGSDIWRAIGAAIDEYAGTTGDDARLAVVVAAARWSHYGYDATPDGRRRRRSSIRRRAQYRAK